MTADGIIFDLDGTLWDSCASIAASWSETIARLHGGLVRLSEQDVRSIMGMTPPQIADALLRVYGDAALQVCQDCLDNEYAYIADHGAALYSGVEQLFDALSQKHSIFIVSNCQSGYIKCFKDYTGLGKYITDYECSGASGNSKADNIRLIADRNGLKAPVYIGDTCMDEDSAKSAGVPFIHAAYGFGQAHEPMAVINAPLELLDIIGE